MKFNGNQADFRSNYSNYYVLVSFFGLIFLIFIFLWSPTSKTSYFFQKPLILSIFMGICILGIMAASYPSRCRRITKFNGKFNGKSGVNISNFNRKSKLKNESVNNLTFNDESIKVIKLEGHHPNCEKFESHTMLIKGKKYCPGCSGLLVGALIAFVGTLFYYFTGLPINYGQMLFWIGVATSLTALSIIIFLKLENINLKFITNLGLVLGSFLVLVGIDTVKGNILIEFYFLLLVLFWIRARITVSEKNHESICRDCRDKSSCTYN